MLASAAACASANYALDKISPGMVSFFIDHLYANFSSTKITFSTRINAKMQKTSREQVDILISKNQVLQILHLVYYVMIVIT